MMGQAIITPDGEVIDGSKMDEIIVRSVVVVTVIRAWDNRLPF